LTSGVCDKVYMLHGGMVVVVCSLHVWSAVLILMIILLIFVMMLCLFFLMCWHRCMIINVVFLIPACLSASGIVLMVRLRK
jgi:hypothetical protein